MALKWVKIEQAKETKGESEWTLTLEEKRASWEWRVDRLRGEKLETRRGWDRNYEDAKKAMLAYYERAWRLALALEAA